MCSTLCSTFFLLSFLFFFLSSLHPFPLLLALQVSAIIDLMDAVKDTNFPSHLPSWLVHNLHALGITSLFPIQSKILACPLESHDVVLKAVTGSGKTLTYLLPILLGEPPKPRLRTEAASTQACHPLTALIIVPTRDLAHQLLSVVQRLTLGSPWTVALLSLPSSSDSSTVAAPLDAHIVISTPGRLSSLQAQARAIPVDWSDLRYLVLDEIDRTLESDNGHDSLSRFMSHMHQAKRHREGTMVREKLVGFDLNWSRNLTTPIRCFKLLCSATVEQSHLYSLAFLSLQDPLWLTDDHDKEMAHEPASLTLDEHMVVLSDDQLTHKPLSLMLLILQLKLSAALIFTNSVLSAKRLHLLLSKMTTFIQSAGQAETQLDSRTVALLSSSESESARQATLAGYHKGQVRWMITTDGSTRGLDLKGLPAVIQYDAPIYAQTYLHRVGRTARAGASGSAYTLLGVSQMHHFKLLLSELNKRQTVKKLGLDSFIQDGDTVDSLSKLRQEYFEVLGLNKDTESM